MEGDSGAETRGPELPEGGVSWQVGQSADPGSWMGTIHAGRETPRHHLATELQLLRSTPSRNHLEVC